MDEELLQLVSVPVLWYHYLQFGFWTAC